MLGPGLLAGLPAPRKHVNGITAYSLVRNWGKSFQMPAAMSSAAMVIVGTLGMAHKPGATVTERAFASWIHRCVSGFLHGMVRYVTQDVDMMVSSTIENLNLIISALTDLGADLPAKLTVDDLTVNTQWHTPSGRIDILLTAIGPNETVITFSELNRHSEMIEIANGILVRTASLDDVIRMKEAADRIKDHQALPEVAQASW